MIYQKRRLNRPTKNKNIVRTRFSLLFYFSCTNMDIRSNAFVHIRPLIFKYIIYDNPFQTITKISLVCRTFRDDIKSNKEVIAIDKVYEHYFSRQNIIYDLIFAIISESTLLVDMTFRNTWNAPTDGVICANLYMDNRQPAAQVFSTHLSDKHIESLIDGIKAGGCSCTRFDVRSHWRDIFLTQLKHRKGVMNIEIRSSHDEQKNANLANVAMYDLIGIIKEGNHTKERTKSLSISSINIEYTNGMVTKCRSVFSGSGATLTTFNINCADKDVIKYLKQIYHRYCMAWALSGHIGYYL